MLMKLNVSESQPVKSGFFALIQLEEQLCVLVNCFRIILRKHKQNEH